MGEALIDEVSISTPRISPDEARAAVTDFLLDHQPTGGRSTTFDGFGGQGYLDCARATILCP